MVARLASIANGTKRLQVRVLRWSFFWLALMRCLSTFRTRIDFYKLILLVRVIIQ